MKKDDNLKNAKQIKEEYNAVELNESDYFKEDVGYRKNNVQKGNFYKQGHGRLSDE